MFSKELKDAISKIRKDIVNRLGHDFEVAELILSKALETKEVQKVLKKEISKVKVEDDGRKKEAKDV